jgi:prephenate dehydrogenase
VPSLNAAPGAVSAVVGLAQAIEAEPFYIDADEHDAYAAAISHVPLVTSIALFGLARSSAAWPELASMSGPAFRDLTRLASGEPVMAHDICLTNGENILHWLERYIEELRRLADLIQEGEPETLFRVIAEAQIEREEFLTNPPKREIDKGDVPDSGTSFMDVLAGGLWSSRAKDITGAIEGRMRDKDREERLRRRD